MTTQLRNPDGSPITVTWTPFGLDPMAGSLLLDRYSADGTPCLIAATSPDETVPLTVCLHDWYPGVAAPDQTWVTDDHTEALAALVAAGDLTPEDSIPPAHYGFQGREVAILYTLSTRLLDQED